MSTQRSISNRLRLRAFRRVSRMFLLTGRLLLVLAGLLLMVMPWTEHYLPLDRFLRGGQDVELGLFALLSLLCLVLVLTQHFRQRIAMLLAAWPWLSLAFLAALAHIPGGATPEFLNQARLCCPPPGTYTPLQI